MADKNVATNNANENTEERFDIALKTPLAFHNLEEQMLLDSRKFCSEFVNPLFKSAYADFKGSVFYVDQRGSMQIILYFDKEDHGDEVVATTRQPEDDGMKNETIRTIRRYQNRATNGTKFYFTKDGKEGLEKFFYGYARKRSKNGSTIDWGRVKKDLSIPTTNGMYGPMNGFGFYQPVGTQYTEVSMISPIKILETVFGTEVDGKNYEYNVTCIRALGDSMAIANGMRSDRYLLNVQRLNTEAVASLAADCGIGNINPGFNIVRA